MFCLKQSVFLILSSLPPDKLATEHFFKIFFNSEASSLYGITHFRDPQVHNKAIFKDDILNLREFFKW